MMECIYCGAKLKEDSVFCMNCGKPVNRLYYYIEILEKSLDKLTRKTDIDSLTHILKMAKELNKNDAKECFDNYLPVLSRALAQYLKCAPTFNANGYLKPKLKKVENALTEALDATEKAFEIRLNEALEEQLDDMYSDISYLNRKISADGMVDSDFEIPE